MGGLLAAAGMSYKTSSAYAAEDPSAGLYKDIVRNEKYTLDRPVTPEKLNLTYNNFYEFGSHKQIHEAAQVLQTRPWEIEVDGEVEKPMTIGIDDLLKKMPLEERLYRHRCVEAWSMTVPWSGFELSKFIELAKPTKALC